MPLICSLFRTKPETSRAQENNCRKRVARVSFPCRSWRYLSKRIDASSLTLDNLSLTYSTNGRCSPSSSMVRLGTWGYFFRVFSSTVWVWITNLVKCSFVGWVAVAYARDSVQTVAVSLPVFRGAFDRALEADNFLCEFPYCEDTGSCAKHLGHGVDEAAVWRTLIWGPDLLGNGVKWIRDVHKYQGPIDRTNRSGWEFEDHAQYYSSVSSRHRLQCRHIYAGTPLHQTKQYRGIDELRLLRPPREPASVPLWLPRWQHHPAWPLWTADAKSITSP